TLARSTVLAVQGPSDAERFKSLGADPERTHVTGNIKFDFSIPPDAAVRGIALRRQYARTQPVGVAGSTHAGEEDVVIAAHRAIRRIHPTALLMLVPRHPPRFE